MHLLDLLLRMVLLQAVALGSFRIKEKPLLRAMTRDIAVFSKELADSLKIGLNKIILDHVGLSAEAVQAWD